jgi:hypothetical protein
LAFFLRIVPKVGPFKALSFKIPTTKTEDMYIKSINQSIEEYGTLLKQTKNGQLHLPDKDFDTGLDTAVGEYSLADQTYARLLDDLDKRHFDQLTPDLRQNILDFYSTGTPIISKKNAKQDTKAWQKTQDELTRLKATTAQPPSTKVTTTGPAE